MKRRIEAVVGIICVAFGVLWILQGLNILPGSFMSGQTMWLAIGIILTLVGAWLLFSLRGGGGRVNVR